MNENNRLMPGYRKVDQKAPAKLNLFFEVLGRRSDQYHEIVSFACPISLCDQVSFERFPTESEELVLKCDCHNLDQNDSIPLGSDNLVIRALHRLREQCGIHLKDWGGIIHLTKHIPSQSGLGGGSSDAAAALRLGNVVWDLGLNEYDLSVIGAEIGSDVPLFFSPGPAVCRGRGEIVEPVFALPFMHFVVLKPPQGLSTARVYAECTRFLDGNTPRNVEPLLDAIREGDLPKFGSLCFNRLEQVVQAIWPEYSQYRNAFDGLDCLAVQMSGSGTSFFGLCRNEEHARQVAKNVAEKNLGQVFQVSTEFDS